MPEPDSNQPFRSEITEDTPLSSVKAEERDIYEQNTKKLDLHLRRGAAYGALVVALGMYIGGGFVAVRFAFFPDNLPQWHIADAILLAFFTIPTILLLAVLRSTNVVAKDDQADSFHAWIGEKFMGWLDKLVDKFFDKSIK